MLYKISKQNKSLAGTIALTASKSESNRLLIIRALCKDHFEIKNLAEAQDTQTLKEIINCQLPIANFTFDVGPAGTTMRFLTAYFCTLQGIRTITGSERMKERPVKILVDALRQLGAQITYLEKDGFPPLSIQGGTLKGGEIEIDGNISSQYISALLLITPALKEGLRIKFKGEVTSRSYIIMTLKTMESLGVKSIWEDDTIFISHQDYCLPQVGFQYTIEADWSAASYWYAMAALSEEVDLHITGLKKNSLQGDAVLVDLFNLLGVNTEFTEKGVHLTKKKIESNYFQFDFSNCPDIAQTIAVATAALNIPSELYGLQTLKIKETDRINALCKELKKINMKAEETQPGLLSITPASSLTNGPLSPRFSTYEDHRMAMSFAPLALKLDEIKIENPEVVKKSYPDFWKDLRSVGFVIEEFIESPYFIV